MTRARDVRRRTAGLAAAAAALVLIGGCSKGFSDGGPDIGFLVPTKAAAKAAGPDGRRAAVIKDKDAPPLRLVPGRRWSFLGTRSGGGSTSVSDVTVESALGAAVPGGAPAGTVLLVSRRGGKVFRTEVLREDGRGGLEMLALGETAGQMIFLSPPLPLYKRPYAEGAYQEWRGTARMRGREFAGRAVTRLTAVERVEGPAGSFSAYRLEHVLALTVGGKPVQYPMAVWFAPEVGIVRRRLADRGAAIDEELRTAPPPLPFAARR